MCLWLNELLIRFHQGMQLKDGMEGLTVFLRLHSDQLRSSGVPEHFWESLYTKLKHEVIEKGWVNKK